MGARRRDHDGPGWVATALGTLLLVSLGFGVGLLAGLVWSEPELVMGHLANRSETVEWDDPDALSVAAGRDEFVRTPEEPPAADEGAVAWLGDPELADAEASSPEPEPVIPMPSDRPSIAELPPPPVAAPPPAAPSPAARPALRSGFSVQVGAFAENGAARKVASDLESKGFPVYVKRAASDGRFRVRVGPVASRGEAERMATRLKREERLPTWVLSEEGV